MRAHMANSEWYEIQITPQEIKKERVKAQDLKRSQWWLNRVNQGVCHYCNEKFSPAYLTMDHVVPIARGGKSTKGNVVVACRNCNDSKKLNTPVDLLLQQFEIK